MNLELLAKRRYEVYAAKHGIRANWLHLTNERKQAWMRDIVDSAKLLTKELKDEVKPVKPLTVGMASYERGFISGVQSERMKYLEKINLFEYDMEEQLNHFNDTNKERERLKSLKK